MATKIWVGGDSGGATDWSVAANWSPSGVPTTGDDVSLANNSIDVGAGLAQSGVTLASLTIDQTYTGKIGTASAYLAIGATVVTIGNPSQSGTSAVGSTRIKINFGTVQTDVTIVNTNTTGVADAGLQPVRLLGTHASNTCTVLGGTVGWATTTPGETSTVATLKVTGQTAKVTMGAGCTLTTVTQSAGALTINSAATTVTLTGGTLTTKGSGAITTANIGGIANLNSTGTITTLNVQKGGQANFNASPAARTVTTPKLYPGAAWVDSLGVVTATNGLALQQCRVSDLAKLDVGTNRTLTVS